MARKELTVARTGRYGTRMLTAGEPVTLDGPKARLFEAMGWAGPTARIKTEDVPPEPIEEVREIDPLDHDGDGRRGGSAKGEQSTSRKGATKRKTSKGKRKARKG